MKIYGIVLAALAVMIVGGKSLSRAGSGADDQPKTEAPAVKDSGKESEREMLIRWQQNRAAHWRGYVMQQQ